MILATQRYKNDGRLRKRLFVPGAFAHPAKGHISLWQEMILRYSNEGDLVLDPLAGIGTSLVAALMGRNVICVELEQHFVEPMRQSWEKMRNMPMLGYQMGQAMILRGDARALPLPDASVVAAITSPPFQDQVPAADPDWFAAHRSEFGGGGIPGSSYTRKPVDAIVTSPPWEEVKPIQDVAFIVRDRRPGREGTEWEYSTMGQRPSSRGYTRPVDAIVTSPPFGEALTGGGIAAAMHGKGDYQMTTNMPGSVYAPESQSQAPENIGNMKGTAYWEAMRRVYAECQRVLKPGGILALVLKGFTRDGQYVDLPGQTEAMLLAAGWQKHDHWRRELWSLSFWRILQRRRDPAAFDERLKYEEVRAFRKPGADGGGVAAVITSPPYEGSEVSSGNVGNRIKAELWGQGRSLAPDRGYTRPPSGET